MTRRCGCMLACGRPPVFFFKFEATVHAVCCMMCTWLLVIRVWPATCLFFKFEATVRLASYPGLPSQLFSQPWKKAWLTHAFFHGCEKSLPTLFSTVAKKAVREGLGTRLRYDCVLYDSEMWLLLRSVSKNFQIPERGKKKKRFHLKIGRQ